jgi:drug/metabolite transporter (DMT)-like permease
MRIPKLAVLALFLLSLIWGYSWIVMKVALRYAGPFDLAALRSLFGAACLFLLLLFSGQPVRPVRNVELFWLGVLQTAGYLILCTMALVEGGAGRTAVLVFTMPFWTVLFAWPLLGERVRGLQWLALALAILGLVLIVEPWYWRGGIVSKLLAVAAGIDWAVSSIMVKRLRTRGQMPLLSLTTWQMIYGSLPLLFVAWVVPERPIQWSAEFMLALGFIAIFTMATGWSLWLYVLNHLPAGAASMSMLAIPVVAIATSYLQLHEVPSHPEVAGMVLIAVALATLSWRAVRQHREMTGTMGQE